MSLPKACILSVSGHTLTDGERKLLSRVNPWGMILMGRSCESPEQVKALTQSVGHHRAEDAVLHRSGRRARAAVAAAGMAGVSGAAVYLPLYKTDPEAGREAVWLHHRLMAAELEPMGIRAIARRWSISCILTCTRSSATGRWARRRRK
jgi:beta-N-acetylhexosaminidase